MSTEIGRRPLEQRRTRAINRGTAGVDAFFPHAVVIGDARGVAVTRLGGVVSGGSHVRGIAESSPGFSFYPRGNACRFMIEIDADVSVQSIENARIE